MRPRGKGPVFDTGEAAYWRTVKPGDFVGIRDTEAFSARLAAPAPGVAGGESADYLVGEIRSFALRSREPGRHLGDRPGLGDPAGEYRFIELQAEGGRSLYLSLIDPGQATPTEAGFELRLYFIPEGLRCGTRDELIDAGEAWLFLPPPDPDDFISSDLEYAPYPDVPEVVEEGRSRKLLFAPLGAGKSLYAQALDTGAAAIITEYAAEPVEGESEIANPLLLVLEEGWIKGDGSIAEEGGYLTILLGKTIRPSDLEHFPAAAGSASLL